MTRKCGFILPAPHVSIRGRFSIYTGLPGGWGSKESACDAWDPGSLGRSPGEGNGCPLQCSCLENSMDRGPWAGGGGRVAQRAGQDWATNTFTTLYFLNLCRISLFTILGNHFKAQQSISLSPSKAQQDKSHFRQACGFLSLSNKDFKNVIHV